MAAAKVIQQAFYGRPADYSYFRGCSTGGRQAMVEAQRFPDDFDGIVSIAPPLDETGITAMHLVWTARAATLKDGRRLIDADDVRRVHAAAVAACDGTDGAPDGVIGNPIACKWRVADLRCVPGREAAGCLSDEKVSAFQKIYDGERDDKGGRLYPGGMLPGSELPCPPPPSATPDASNQRATRSKREPATGVAGEMWLRGTSNEVRTGSDGADRTGTTGFSAGSL